VPDLDTYFTAIEALRVSAAAELEVIAQAAGRDSPLHLRCQEAWRQREAAASLSLQFDDFDNATEILDRGVHSLQHALDAAQREHLPVEQVYALIKSC